MDWRKEEASPKALALAGLVHREFCDRCGEELVEIEESGLGCKDCPFAGSGEAVSAPRTPRGVL